MRHVVARDLNLLWNRVSWCFCSDPMAWGRRHFSEHWRDWPQTGKRDRRDRRRLLSDIPRESLAKRRSIVLTQQPSVISMRGREVVALGRLPYRTGQED